MLDLPSREIHNNMNTYTNQNPEARAERILVEHAARKRMAQRAAQMLMGRIGTTEVRNFMELEERVLQIREQQFSLIAGIAGTKI